MDSNSHSLLGPAMATVSASVAPTTQRFETLSPIIARDLDMGQYDTRRVLTRVKVRTLVYKYRILRIPRVLICIWFLLDTGSLLSTFVETRCAKGMHLNWHANDTTPAKYKGPQSTK